MIGLRVTIPPALAERARKFAELSAPGALDRWRGEISKAAALAVRSYARTNWIVRHKTANRLGGVPTRFLEQSIDRITPLPAGKKAGLEIAGKAAIALRRVDAPVTIRPRTKTWLTIPATGRAYGRRAGEFSNLRFVPFHRGRMPALVDDDGRVQYWLKKRVVIPKDRTLLPTAATFAAAASDGTRTWMRLEIQPKRK